MRSLRTAHGSYIQPTAARASSWSGTKPSHRHRIPSPCVTWRLLCPASREEKPPPPAPLRPARRAPTPCAQQVHPQQPPVVAGNTAPTWYPGYRTALLTCTNPREILTPTEQYCHPINIPNNQSPIHSSGAGGSPRVQWGVFRGPCMRSVGWPGNHATVHVQHEKAQIAVQSSSTPS